jgi:hypothetical protein
VQIIPDRLPKMEKSKLRQEMSGGVVAANVKPPLPPLITGTKAANVTPQPPRQTTTVANATREPPPQISVTSLATPPSSALTVEQMRTAGALAGARQKAKLAANKRL